MTEWLSLTRLRAITKKEAEAERLITLWDRQLTQLLVACLGDCRFWTLYGC